VSVEQANAVHLETGRDEAIRPIVSPLLGRLYGRVLVSTCVAFVIVLALACGDGAVSPVIPPSPTPGAVGTITAAGTIAYINPSGELALTDPAGTASQVISGFSGVVAFQWSPAGSLIAAEVEANGTKNVVVLDPAGGLVFEIAGAEAPVWSPAGDRLVAVRSDGALVVDSEGQEVLSLAAALRPEWSPDGSQLAYLEQTDDGLAVPVIVTVETGERHPFPDEFLPAEPVFPISWHPAGELIAYMDALYEPATEAVVSLEGVPVNWSPDGRLLLQTVDTDPATGSTTAQIYDFSQDGAVTIALEVRPSTDGEPPWLYIDRWIAWTTDGRILLYMDPQPSAVQVRMYDTVAITQDRYRNIQGREPDISPSGEHVAFFDGGKVWVFALDATALVDIVDGTRPAWRPLQ